MKLHTSSRKTVLGGLTVVLCLAVASTAWAKVTPWPDACSFDLCHDMQAGNDNLMKDEYADNQGCFNCHSSDTSSTTYELTDGVNSVTVPVVVYTGGSEPTEYLAGGNFWWVKGPATGDPQDPNYWTGGCDDTRGHNIFPGEPDDYLTMAPGGAGCTYNTFCHANLHTVDTSGVAGPRQGCLKCHMMRTSGLLPDGFHHADDTLDTVVGGDTNDTDGYFRFLSGHLGGDAHGVCGIEDPDWQATSGSGDHNEYLGNESNLNVAGTLSQQGHTMTGYCSGCHGNFHISSDSAGGGDWVRHPAGAVLPDSGEFASYTTFNPLVPVARPGLTGWTGPSSTVTPGIDLAMCLSCHRAHGSPYPKMLRWDPTDADGCITCHSTKVTGTPDQYHVVEVDDCSVCHAAHGDGPPDFGPNENESLVAKVITTPNSGDKPVTFPSGYTFVSGNPDYDGICEVCHTQTHCYRNCLCDEHPLYTAGVPVDPGWDCTSCHSHSKQFCGPTNQIHATHFVSDQGPLFPQDETGCTECHAYGIEQCQDSPWFWDNKPIEETQVCGLICHGI